MLINNPVFSYVLGVLILAYAHDYTLLYDVAAVGMMLIGVSQTIILVKRAK